MSEEERLLRDDSVFMLTFQEIVELCIPIKIIVIAFKIS